MCCEGFMVEGKVISSPLNGDLFDGDDRFTPLRDFGSRHDADALIFDHSDLITGFRQKWCTIVSEFFLHLQIRTA
jgi:hypothetical protein